MKRSSWLLVLCLTISIINYPNPFNPKGGEVVTFECTSDSTLESVLYLYDLSAQVRLRRAFSLAGGATNRLVWNGYGDNNELVGNGLYLYRVVDAVAKCSLAKGKVWVINK
jgi:hypothetical protein